MEAGAVIVAAGAGVRMGTAAGLRKQYLTLEGTPVLLRALAAFEEVASVREIVVVVPAEDVEWVDRQWLAPRRRGRVLKAVAGGPSRQASVSRGREALSEACRWVVVHDAARPLVTPGLIQRVLAAAQETGAAVAGVPVTDTVKRVDGSGRVLETLPRESLRAIQTPQAFRRDVLTRAHQLEELLHQVTDDAALVEHLGIPVTVVDGDPDNIKLTRPRDLAWAQALLRDRKDAAPEAPSPRETSSGFSSSGFPLPFRVGYGFDVHRLVEGRPLILGGVSIPWAKGLMGHSDADVLAHAVTDAVLGAAGLGDIGRHFPDTDEAYRGADSIDLLARAVNLAAARGWRVGQVDATVVAQEPKLAPYISEMEERLAGALGVGAGCVNVKASTSEGLGFAGRGEGMAAYAVAVLWRHEG